MRETIYCVGDHDELQYVVIFEKRQEWTENQGSFSIFNSAGRKVKTVTKDNLLKKKEKEVYD